MARGPRKKSETGIYHIMLRGIDKRNIFLDKEDKEVFLSYLFRARELGGFKLYAYCLMDNHVHLLIKEGEDLGTSIKRITVGYVQKHNIKHGRVGHLFQNRYKSETITNDSYLISAVRYIHQNPIKAKLVKEIEKYKWSSYKEYLLTYNKKPSKIDTEPIAAYFNNLESFHKYMKENSNDKFLEYKENKKITDKELQIIINEKFDKKDLNKMTKIERDIIIKEVYNLTGASIIQLSNLMKVNRGIIQRAIKTCQTKRPHDTKAY